MPRMAATRPPRALLIDDEPALLALMARAFEAAGWVTAQAGNGRQGLNLLASYAPDLVVTDIVMPEMEGIGTILEIRRRPSPPKVIAISGARLSRNADYLTWASQLGADHVLSKPFRLAELVRLADTLIPNQHTEDGA